MTQYDCFDCKHHGICIYFRTVSGFKGLFDTDAIGYSDKHHHLYNALAWACQYFDQKEEIKK